MSYSPEVHGAQLDQPLTLREIEEMQFDRRAKDGEMGLYDMRNALRAAPAALFFETLQTEAQHPEDYIQLGQIGYPYKLFEDIANAPLDWKAMVPAVAAYGVVSALTRVRSFRNYSDELAGARLAAIGADGFVPHTEKSLKRFQRIERTKRAASTILAMGAAYKVGEQLDTMQDLALASSIAVGGLVAPKVTSRLRRRGTQSGKQRQRRIRRPLAAQNTSGQQELSGAYDAHLDPDNWL